MSVIFHDMPLVTKACEGLSEDDAHALCGEVEFAIASNYLVGGLMAAEVRDRNIDFQHDIDRFAPIADELFTVEQDPRFKRTKLDEVALFAALDAVFTKYGIQSRRTRVTLRYLMGH